MPVCYFENDDKKYNCEYEINDDSIEVIVDYDIEDEVETVNGVKIFSVDTEYIERDILVIDYKNKANFLLKKAFYIGHVNVYGTPDDGSKAKFKSFIYFSHNDFNKLSQLLTTPKINKIRIYSHDINTLIGHPSLKETNNTSEYILYFVKKYIGEKISVNYNNIKNIIISDDWNSLYDGKKNNIQIELNGYIELSLNRRVNYDQVYQFIYELIVYMQLFRPNKFLINKLKVMVDGKYYEISMQKNDIKYTEKNMRQSVNCSISDFLEICYSRIPYRKSKMEIRNIPYIIMGHSKNIEDDFLMFYRFIECYYKKQKIPNIKKTFLAYSIIEHYLKKNSMSDSKVEDYSREIISLRNQYVHSGYYLKNSSLKVKYEKINGKKNPKDHTINNIDIDWIYERTKMLYDIAIDIIFTKMLGFDEYNFINY